MIIKIKKIINKKDNNLLINWLIQILDCIKKALMLK